MRKSKLKKDKNFYKDDRKPCGRSDAELDVLDNSQDIKTLTWQVREVPIEVRSEGVI